jgi:hypothetical protein
MILRIRRFGVCLALVQAVVLSAVAASAPSAAADDAGRAITAEGILGHIKILSSDEYEGHLPGTRGGELTVQYITEQFKGLGLAPGNPDGTYVQAVALNGVRGTARGSFTAGGQTIALEFPKDAVARTERFLPSVKVADSDMIFVGYGVVAPEYH